MRKANPRQVTPAHSATRVCQRTWVRLIAGACVAIAFSTAGCGGGKPDKSTEQTKAGDDKAADGKAKPTPGDNAKEDGEAVAEAKPGKAKKPSAPEIDGIPLDVVWFDEPLAVAADNTAVGGAPPTTVATTKPKGNGAMASGTSEPAATPAPAAAPAASGSGDWGDLITMDVVAAEAKKIKNRLTDNLSNVGKYNGNYKDNIQMDGIVLASLAQVATKIDGSIGWKGDAPAVRDLATEVSKKAKGLGQASYDPTKQAFDKLEGMLSGNKPAGLEESPPELPFGEFATRTAVMKRMQKAYDFMKSSVTTEAAFKKEAEAVQHEASVLAVMSKICASKEYPSADEDEYQQFMKDLVQACQEINGASKGETFAPYQEAMSKMQRLCDNCHMAYRFE